MLLIKTQVNWPFGSREEKKNKFQDGDRFGHLGFPIGTILAILIYKSPRCFRPTFKSTVLSVEEKKLKIDFKDGGHGGHLGFPIRSGFQDRNDFSYL